LAGKLLYFIINKPFGVLSQFTEENKNPGLSSLFKLPRNVYPVGRLDLDSEGLLILTNDKKLNSKLLNPKNKHSKTYWVEVEGVPSQEAVEILEKGVIINLKGRKHSTSPAKVNLIKKPDMEERSVPVNRLKHPKTSWMEIAITEGKNRQVRRMTAAIGHPTLRLIRVAIEDLKLGTMKPGEITQISEKSIMKKLNIKSFQV
jgi:23S rRNA pseudouridine2457 synthase